jgi:hypothetical protein
MSSGGGWCLLVIYPAIKMEGGFLGGGGVILGFELRAFALVRQVLPVEPHFLPFLLWFLWRWDLAFCPGHQGL